MSRYYGASVRYVSSVCQTSCIAITSSLTRVKVECMVGWKMWFNELTLSDKGGILLSVE